MHLLFELFRDFIEAERSGTLQEDQFIVQASESAGGEEMVHVGKEQFIGDMDSVCLGCEFGANTYEFVDATLHTEVRDLGIEGLRGGTGLEHVREDEGFVQTTPNPS